MFIYSASFHWVCNTINAISCSRMSRSPQNCSDKRRYSVEISRRSKHTKRGKSRGRSSIQCTTATAWRWPSDSVTVGLAETPRVPGFSEVVYIPRSKAWNYWIVPQCSRTFFYPPGMQPRGWLVYCICSVVSAFTGAGLKCGYIAGQYSIELWHWPHDWEPKRENSPQDWLWLVLVMTVVSPGAGSSARRKHSAPRHSPRRFDRKECSFWSVFPVERRMLQLRDTKPFKKLLNLAKSSQCIRITQFGMKNLFIQFSAHYHGSHAGVGHASGGCTDPEGNFVQEIRQHKGQLNWKFSNTKTSWKVWARVYWLFYLQKSVTAKLRHSSVHA